MNEIIKKYHLAEGSILVNHREGPNGVDCWFETDTIRQHRCLSNEDFEKLEGE